MSKYVTFKQNGGRFGNQIFPYLLAKIIGINFGHTYIDHENFMLIHNNNKITIHEDVYQNFDTSLIRNNHIELDGYFQQSIYYIEYRHQLINIVNDSNNMDYWTYNYQKIYIVDFFKVKSMINFTDNDILISLRLDDFIQLPCPKSDILPLDYYTNILDQTKYDKLYIVSDAIKHGWEYNYLRAFDKYKYIHIQGTIESDAAVMRSAKMIIHSNSTLCWVMSFLSNKISRHIPNTNFYPKQKLLEIEPSDKLYQINTLTHDEVYNVNKYFNIHPLSYCIPDDILIDINTIINNKHIIISDVIPGERLTYRFKSGQEKLYNQHYQESYFAYSVKKGGWDCLRHYEILVNGCIPIFKDLDKCPASIMINYPKELIMEATSKLLPWNNDIELYKNYLNKIYTQLKATCTSRSQTKYILNIMNLTPKNILLIRCHEGVNYSRELLWIGLKQYIQNLNGIAVEYPKIEYLYKNYTGDLSQLYGFGYNYSRKLDDDYNFTSTEIIDRIKDHFWDLIIFGKVGPDEMIDGSIPNLPLWSIINHFYTKNEIAFIYGGDETVDMTTYNRYSEHVYNHRKYGHCFVRELKL